MEKDRINELVSLFGREYSYISCERNVVEKAASMVCDFPDDRALDCMQDYILSQGLADEVVE